MRVIVPGAIGAKSVKWLNQIVIKGIETTTEDFNFFLPQDIYVPDAFGEERRPQSYDTPITLMHTNVNSAITNIFDGDYLFYGKPFVLKGYATGRSIV